MLPFLSLHDTSKQTSKKKKKEKKKKKKKKKKKSIINKNKYKKNKKTTTKTTTTTTTTYPYSILTSLKYHSKMYIRSLSLSLSLSLSAHIFKSFAQREMKRSVLSNSPGDNTQLLPPCQDASPLGITSKVKRKRKNKPKIKSSCKTRQLFYFCAKNELCHGGAHEGLQAGVFLKKCIFAMSRRCEGMLIRCVYWRTLVN